MLTLFACNLNAGRKLQFTPQFGPNHNKSTAFFEGIRSNYLFSTPPNFIIDYDQSKEDEYSFAFIPENENYYEANAIIGINIYSLESTFNFPQFIKDDTLRIRELFGHTLEIIPVSDIFNFNGDELITFYFNDTSRYIPVIMSAYYYQAMELIIYELTITDNFPKIEAENKFIEAVESFRVLPKGTLGSN